MNYNTQYLVLSTLLSCTFALLPSEKNRSNNMPLSPSPYGTYTIVSTKNIKKPEEQSDTSLNPNSGMHNSCSTFIKSVCALGTVGIGSALYIKRKLIYTTLVPLKLLAQSINPYQYLPQISQFSAAGLTLVTLYQAYDIWDVYKNNCYRKKLLPYHIGIRVIVPALLACACLTLV